MYHQCAPCHRPGQPAPFSLLTYDDVKRHATQIAAVAKSGNSEEALLRYRGSLEYRAPDAELHTKMGLMLARLSRFSEAQIELETALKLDPNFQPAKAMLRDVQARLR